MKLRIVYTFLLLGMGAFLFFGNAGGRAGSQGQGNTGAPGDETIGAGVLRTCQTCHNSGGFQTGLDFEIADAAGAAITNYVPGETYDVTFTINATPMPSGYGFQIVALNAPEDVDGASVNTWTTTAGNVQIATANNGRQYAEHGAVSTSNEFVMQWTAPDVLTGDVTFYYCGNAIDGNGNTMGDNATCSKMTIPQMPVSVNELERKIAWSIFPNPVQDVMHLKSVSQTSGTFDLRIFDQAGKNVFSKNLEITQGEEIALIDVATLSSGIYNIVLTDGKDNISKKIIKQ